MACVTIVRLSGRVRQCEVVEFGVLYPGRGRRSPTDRSDQSA